MPTLGSLASSAETRVSSCAAAHMPAWATSAPSAAIKPATCREAPSSIGQAKLRGLAHAVHRLPLHALRPLTRRARGRRRLSVAIPLKTARLNGLLLFVHFGMKMHQECLMVDNLSALIDTVQKNCTIADARHAREMTMCTFLLEMREYYRWEMEIPYGARLPKDELGDWLNARESLWDTVEEEDFAPLPLSEAGIDPFEADDINRALIPQGLVYSSGLGSFRKPHFVLAELKRAEVREGVQVLVVGCEYARDLIAPPAARRDGAIFLRMDAVDRLLWNKYEEWQWKERDTALGRAFAHYDFECDIERGLDRMAEAESEAMILHEIGEARAESLLGDDWSAKRPARCISIRPTCPACGARCFRPCRRLMKLGWVIVMSPPSPAS